MTWDEHYPFWTRVRQRPEHEGQSCLQAARKRVAQNTADDWRWLESSLDDPERKWFVAQVFRFHPLPQRLFVSMLRAGVLERNPSFNRQFIEPCVRSMGQRRVLEELLTYLKSGTDEERAGAASAFYWAYSASGCPCDESLEELLQQIRCEMLRQFVCNPDLQVRRRIIPMLGLDPDTYPADLRPLVPQAIETARAHPDEYIRHRVEIQLGSGGPFMAIPDT